MIILTLRTDKPEAEIGLYDNGRELTYANWHAHRELAETLHEKMKEILDAQSFKLNQLQGIIVYKGPGSFTGLRIGITVANALADSLSIPIVSESDEAWVQNGRNRLELGENEQVVQPEYGAPPHITQQKR